MYKKHIFLSVSFLCVNVQAMQQDAQEKSVQEQAQLLFLTLNPQEIAQESRHWDAYDIRNAREVAKLINDGVQVDSVPVLKKMEQNKHALPKTFAVIMAGKVVQNWNPPMTTRPDGSKYSYRELTTMEFGDALKLGDPGKILPYKLKFSDAILKLREFSDARFERYFDNSATPQKSGNE
jgi:hypothetical protein